MRRTSETVMTHRLIRRLLPAAGIAAVLALSPVTAQRAVSSDDWPAYNRTFTGDRFSPLSTITTGNVARLRPVCTFETGEQVSFQTGPVVVNGTMYVTSDRGTYAIDAATCAVKWKQLLTFPPSSLQVNRGVAYDNGRVFRGAGPGHVIALDAATGATAWDVQLSPFVPGMTVPMAPVAWNGMVFVGNAGGDNYGVTGHVWALDQKDGHTIWRFDVVPESGPARGVAARATTCIRIRSSPSIRKRADSPTTCSSSKRTTTTGTWTPDRYCSPRVLDVRSSLPPTRTACSRRSIDRR